MWVSEALKAEIVGKILSNFTCVFCKSWVKKVRTGIWNPNLARTPVSFFLIKNGECPHLHSFSWTRAQILPDPIDTIVKIVVSISQESLIRITFLLRYFYTKRFHYYPQNIVRLWVLITTNRLLSVAAHIELSVLIYFNRMIIVDLFNILPQLRNTHFSHVYQMLINR